MFEFNATDLFKQRLVAHMKLLNRYLRYIFNGHFMIALLFMLITLLVYYQKWLENMDDRFPAALVMAVVLGFVVSYNPLQFFLKAPDEVFILVKEQAMHRYFMWGLLYNYIVQLYIVIAALAVVGPLYTTVYPANSGLDFIMLIIIMLIIKAWNVAANWMMMKIRDGKIQLLDKTLRMLLSMALFYCFLKGTFVILAAILFFAAIGMNYMLTRRQGGLAWDVLIQNDHYRLAFFYRFVSMFADVPQLSKRLKKRRSLARAINRFIPFSQKALYDYLYRLTFVRSSDYLHLFIRLTVLGGVIIYFVSNFWLKIAFALLFLYMTSFQLIPLYHHYRTSIWPELYPVPDELRKNAFLKGMKQLALVQTILFACLFFIWLDVTGAVLTFVAGSLFNGLFHRGYVAKRLTN